jgi:putative flippase GtrA
LRLQKEIKAFSKAQISAFVGGVIDYALMVFCYEFFHLHYVYGIVIGGVVGAAINFSINKHWSFRGNQGHAVKQLWKFILVVIGSIFLKSSGTFFLTELMTIDYRISRLLTDALVSFGFNYNLQRFWVFRRQMVS